MHDFRDNAATFLLATPSASRGLDLPAVSYVYNLSCPDVTTYLHQAGRAGRIGSTVKGEPPAHNCKGLFRGGDRHIPNAKLLSFVSNDGNFAGSSWCLCVCAGNVDCKCHSATCKNAHSCQAAFLSHERSWRFIVA